MQQSEFKTEKREIILSATASAGVTLVLSIFLLIIISSDRISTTLFWAIIPLVIILIAILIFDILRLATIKITIDSNQIIYSDFVSKKRIELNSLSHYLISPKKTVLIGKFGNKIMATYKINGKELLDGFLQENCKISTEYDEKNIPSLSKFKRISFTLNCVAVFGLLGSLFSPFYTEIFLAVLFILPIVGFALVFYSKGVIKFLKNRHDSFPSIFLVFLLSVVGLCARIISLYGEILDVWLLCLYICLLTSALFVTYLMAEKKHFKKIQFKVEKYPT